MMHEFNMNYAMGILWWIGIFFMGNEDGDNGVCELGKVYTIQELYRLHAVNKDVLNRNYP